MNKIAGLVVIASLVSLAHGQITQGGTPYSHSNILADSIATINMVNVDVAALLAEDEMDAQSDNPKPFRFGFAHQVSFGLDDAGTWSVLPNGDRIWRLRIVAPAALSVNLIYDQFYMPEGARLFIYNPNHSSILGAFTSGNNKDHGKFATAPVAGSVSILEYYEPAGVTGLGIISISRVIHGYKSVLGIAKPSSLQKSIETSGFGDSDTCNINVNCPEGAEWADEKRSVVMILLDENTRWCSGAIVNNTGLDYKPYILTAFHCIDYYRDDILTTGEIDFAEDWLVWFNYESPGCTNADGPTDQSVASTTFKAANVATDFALVELSVTPPTSYNVYYAGWSRATSPPSSSVGIHHPMGDITKISFENDQASSYTWPGMPTNFQLAVNFNSGAVQVGSSGSPLLDESHRIVGQLTGFPGDEDDDRCEVRIGYYGKLAMSWDYGSTAAERLKDWLDPNSSNALTLGGMEGEPRPVNLTLGSGASLDKAIVYTASSSITANAVDIESTGDVRFVSKGTIKLLPGFHAKAGSNFKAYIDPSLSVSPPPPPTVTISGDWRVDEGETGNWSAATTSSGCTTGLSYQWYYRSQATSYDWEADGYNSSNYSYTVQQYDLGLEIKVEVACDAGSDSDVMSVLCIHCDIMPKRISAMPEVYAMHRNYPNPFNPTTRLDYDLPEASLVSIAIYDILGREIRRWDMTVAAGYRSLIWHGKNKFGQPVSSGIYIYRLVATSVASGERFIASEKMIFLK